MHSATSLLLAALATLTTVAATSGAVYDPYAPGVFPNFTYMMTATLHIISSQPPIEAYEGGFVAETTFGAGPLNGPALNGTINGGVSSTLLDPSFEFVTPDIQLYGQSNDGEYFVVHVTGAGPLDDHWNRADITVGGKYEYMQNEFIVAHHLTVDETTIEVPIYCLGCNQTVVGIINGC